MNEYLGYYAIGALSSVIVFLVLIFKFFCKLTKQDAFPNSKLQSKNIDIIKKAEKENEEKSLIKRGTEEKKLANEKIDKDKTIQKSHKIKKSNQANSFLTNKFFELEIKGFNSNIVYLAYRYENDGKVSLAIAEVHLFRSIM